VQRQEIEGLDLKIEALEEYNLFLNSIKSIHTKKAYDIYMKKYYEFCNGDLLLQSEPKVIERKIIDFIILLKERGLKFKALKNYVTAISSFYKINDVILNIRKINKFMPEQKRVKKDNAYTREQIHSLLDVADDRYKVIILLMASTGMRVGAIPELKIRDLEKLENDIYKVTVYEGFKEEYTTFTTPECSKAIDRYLEARQRYGEILNPDSPVVREQFDVKKHLNITHPKKTTVPMMYRALTGLSVRAGIRTQEKLDENSTKQPASCRKEIAACHGFRKFFTTQLIESDLKTELRWLLEGHNLKGNDTSYIRTTEKRLLEEYMKAVDNLTINEENRLLKKVDTLKREKTSYEFLNSKIDSLQNHFVEIFDNIAKNKDTLNSVPIEELMNFLKKRQEIDQ
jgi:integrase